MLKRCLGLTVGLLVLGSSVGWAQSAFQGVEVLVGYDSEELIGNQEDYVAVPVFIGFDFDAKPFFQKFNWAVPGLMQFVWEPTVAYVEDSEMEAGLNALLKIGLLPEESKFQPYVKAGAGGIYISRDTIEQSTDFNFTIHGAFGFHYFIQENIALTAEYRYRHLSNADIDEPNWGLDNHFGLLGIAYRF